MLIPRSTRRRCFNLIRRYAEPHLTKDSSSSRPRRPHTDFFISAEPAAQPGPFACGPSPGPVPSTQACSRPQADFFIGAEPAIST